MNKKTILGLTGFLIVVFGILGSFFYAYYEDVSGQTAALKQELAAAQEKVTGLEKEREELLAEKEILKEEAEYVTVMGKDGSMTRYPKLGFSVDLDSWQYLLVNELNPLPRDFEVELAFIKNGQKVDKRIKESLVAMICAGRKDGMSMMVCYSYRT